MSSLPPALQDGIAPVESASGAPFPRHDTQLSDLRRQGPDHSRIRTVALPAGGFQLLDGQIINLDLNAVQLLFAPSVPPVVGPLSIYLTAPPVPAPVTVGVQQVVLDPTAMIGFWLSRAVEISFN